MNLKLDATMAEIFTAPTAASAPLSLDDVLSRPVQKRLIDGVYHGKITTFERSTKDQLIRVKYTLDDGRVISENRWPLGLAAMGKQLAEQFECSDEDVPLPALLYEAKTNGCNLWVSHNEVTQPNQYTQRPETRVFQNIDFVPRNAPAATPTNAETVA